MAARADEERVIDHLEHFKLSAEEVDEHFDATQALDRLGEGLHWLYQRINELERRARAKAAKENVLVDPVLGLLGRQPIGLLSRAFQWYAVSACNYAQLVGWLETRNPEAAKNYVARNLPRLLSYRNKVAAHFALTAPRGDNEADLAPSAMTHISYVGGRR